MQTYPRHRLTAFAIVALAVACPHVARAEESARTPAVPDVVETVMPALGLIGLVYLAYCKGVRMITDTPPATK